MKRLSVCMIVKDEEELLPRCLDSVQGIADEIIVVDTGSTDLTKQIAEEYSAQLYDYTWSNDFAAARNESIRHASGKWILVLDADEYLAKEEYVLWNDFLETEKPIHHLAYTLPVINFTGDKESDDEMTTAPVTRLFPNFKGIFFERPIHEQLTRGTQGELFHKKIAMNIYHTGYQTKRLIEKNKHERNMSIFNSMKKDDNMSEYDWFTLGNQYRYAKNEEEAIRCYERALVSDSSRLAWYPHCLIGLISLYFQENQLYLVDEWTTNKLVAFNEYADYHTIKGIQYETMGFFKQAEECYLEAIRIAEQRANKDQEIWLVDPMYSFETPVQQLVGIYFRLNESKQAIYWLSKLLNKNNRNPQVLLKLVEWLCQHESQDEVTVFLNKIYDVSNTADCELLFKVSLVLGQVELVRYYAGLLSTLANLSTLDQLRFGIMMDDQKIWLDFSGRGQSEYEQQFQAWIQMAVGAIKWNGSTKLQNVAKQYRNKSIDDLTVIMISFIQGDFVNDDQLLIQYADNLFSVAKQLFLIKDYENFDKFIQAMKTPELINQLANYFFNLGLTELAMNYYSILLAEQQLDLSSLVNLGMYHANQHFYEDAVEFLSAAVQQKPSSKHLYYTLIKHADRKSKSSYMNQFMSECSEVINISFVKEFLTKEKQISVIK
ncbi:glycosyltransferase [Paenibacillus sp. LMG 31459]|uniref:Glycosyltransferase n=1 Tax=Paenibacillus phytohabitans TaxID=2654978 RepID=A0ABX1YE38_9BACL|nr:glycosyltransferase [Paenibacillus phytohabitans]NOU79242.1 glycosyltransferase [Paenibacillus phytohabitans]